jgi:DNA-binding NarL/FixJ family response regulator
MLSLILLTTAMRERKKTAVIVDDHPLFRERLSQLFDTELNVGISGEVDKAEQAMLLVRNTSPDLTIVNITLKGLSGLELIKCLKALSLPMAILAVSSHDEALYAERAFRGGARGYIAKNQPGREFVSAVRRVLGGEVYLSRKMSSLFLERIIIPGAKGMGRRIEDLTDRELEVLDSTGRGHTSREIASSLKLSAATVDTYRARIKEKMNLQNSAQLQHFAIRWVLERESKNHGR